MKEQLLIPTLKWAKANSSAAVNLWYDSVHTEQVAIKHTQDVLSSMMANEFKGITVHLKDIREIPIVQENPDAFSYNLPVYFRIDLLKAIIVVDAIEREGNDAAIFSDLEVGDRRPNKDRMSKVELFSPLKDDSSHFAKSGLILNNDARRIENQFIQLYNNPAMIFAIKHAVINVNLTRAISALNFKCEKKLLKEDYIQSLSRSVFSSIREYVFAFYEAITGTKYRLTVQPDIIGKGFDIDALWIPYNPDEHGYAPFGLYCFQRYGEVVLGDESITVRDVITLPKVNIFHCAAREVDVRVGRDHYEISHSERILKPAVSSDGIYRCKLMGSASLAASTTSTATAASPENIFEINRKNAKDKPPVVFSVVPQSTALTIATAASASTTSIATNELTLASHVMVN